jgi:hypothetical protein
MSGSRLLDLDSAALDLACAAYGDMPKDALLHLLHGVKSPRAGRPISSPRAVASIIKELRANWNKSRPVCKGCGKHAELNVRSHCAGCDLQEQIAALRALIESPDESESDKAGYRKELARLEAL